MKLTTIDQKNHQVLRTPARVVTFPLTTPLLQLINEMTEFILELESPYGSPAGLAAPQVGQGWRIIFMQIPEEAKTRRKDVENILPLTVWINPSYKPIEEFGKIKDWEGCYSVPDAMGEVYRWRAVEYQAYDLDGKLITGKAQGFFARLIQHEVGHLNGELFKDLVTEECRYGPFSEMIQIRMKEFKENKY